MAAGKTGKKRDLNKARKRDRDRSPGRDVAAWRNAIDEMLVDVALSHLGDANGSLPECYAWLEGKWSILAELGRLAANGDHGIVITVAKGLCEIEQPVKLSERMVRNIRLMIKMRRPPPPPKEVLSQLERAIAQCGVRAPSAVELRALLEGLRAPLEHVAGINVDVQDP